MNDHDPAEEALLADARRQLSPSDQDVARVLGALRTTLASGAATSGSSVGATGPAPRLARPWLLKLMAALTIAGVSGAVGYALGVRATEQRAPLPVPASAPVALPSALLAVEHEPTLPEAQQDHAPPRDRDAPVRPAQSAREAGMRSMKQELDAMRRVDRLLHEDNPQRALALLQQLDRSVPDGKLMQERAAAAVIARCALGTGESARVADEFAARYPDSVYLARVRQKCQSNLRISTAPETHE